MVCTRYTVCEGWCARTRTRNAVNGTAAEHMSLTLAEREKLHEHFVRLGAGKLDTIVAHCGASNLTDTKQLVRLYCVTCCVCVPYRVLW